jgi:undecaprenyl-diphosphatase
MKNRSTQLTSERSVTSGWWVGLAAGLALVPVVALADKRLATALRPDALPWLVGAMGWVTWLGYGAVDIGVPVGIGLAGWCMGNADWGRRGLRGGVAVALAGLVDQALKNLSCRARPSAADAGAFFSGFPCVPAPYALASFPSGHATTAFALAVVLSLWYPRLTLVWLLLAAAVGWSRIVLGSHFPSDVLAGAVLGVAVVLVLARRWPSWLLATDSASPLLL